MTNVEKVRKREGMTRFGLAFRCWRLCGWDFWGCWQYIKFVETHFIIMTESAKQMLAVALDCTARELEEGYGKQYQ